ncbi:MAG TPA: hypothetical protein VNZ52_15450 [Candidatus Thermoplasmatota archaeon]|nr:hypothetical protein [Candidatus Thermoplasmatota archaeon]
MSLAAELVGAFFTNGFSPAQAFGLFFLLGSFTVATVSDLRHMAAQREFVEVWFAFAAAMLVLDLWLAEFTLTAPAFLVKWGLIIALSVMSHRRVGPLFHLATGDVAACAAAASVLPAGWVAVFFLLLKVTDVPLGPLLARGRNAYPFMPVVTLATVLVLGLAAWASGAF